MLRMKRKSQVKVFSIVASILMVISLIAPGAAFAQPNANVSHSLNDSKQLVENKVSDRLLSNFKDDEYVTFLVKFNEKAEVEKVAKNARDNAAKANLSNYKAEHVQRSAVIAELKETSFTSQQNVKAFVEEEIANGNAKEFKSYHIVNGMAVTATKEVAEKIATFSEVEKLLPNEMRQLYTTVSKDAETPKSDIANVEWNVERVGAPAAWDMGFDGTGTVVASIDSGVQWNHPALKEKYRGYDAATGEVDHTYSWFDATADEDTPYDDQGHGTHVTGTMVGSEPDGSNQVGVAPGAKFISARAFTTAGGADTDLLDAAQWILAPGGDVSKAPDVVNNSWGGGPGLDEWYRDAVIAWRAAEIFPEFSAGNTTLFNPGGPGSIATPANYPESFATGATDINDNLASFSLQGPSPYEGDIKPDISAPGVNIRSTVPGGGYEGGWNGTSMAGPAVSATVALMKQANASLTVDELEDILMNTATPLTDGAFPESPNMGYGHGLVNAHDAVAALATGLGTLEGQVTKDGEDDEAPTFQHDAPSQTFEGMDLPLEIDVQDNVSISNVELQYRESSDDDWKSMEAELADGDYRDATYIATIPGEDITGSSISYRWNISDYGNNDITTDVYEVSVEPGITVGYFQDFESAPVGWASSGENNTWEWGVPTYGPDSAFSGEKVYATNLDGDYSSSSDMILAMPPVDLPDGDSYLQFKHWHEINAGFDFGYVVISTDQENWEQLATVDGDSDGWEDYEVSLSDYAGQRVYVGFHFTSTTVVNEAGWYLDDVALTDASIAGTNQLGVVSTQQEKSSLNKTKSKDVKEAEVSNLPLAATVSILESGRSVNTDPANGSYSLLHAAGEFTAVAEAYGFHSDEQSVTIEADGTTTANFNLEEIDQYTVSGTVTDEQTGEPVEGATLLLVEDANVEPVETDVEGNYTLTAYEGEYTLKVLAAGYHGTEVDINLDGEDATVNVELEPFYTVPGGEIAYDDGTAENARAYYDAGNKWAVKMSLPEGEDAAIVTDGVFQFHGTDWPNPGGTEFAVEVWDATGTDGMPGEKLAGPIDAEAVRSLDEWTVVDLTEHAIQVEGDFYMVYVQTAANPNVPGLATDENGPNAERSYQSVGGAWSATPAAEGNYMIRARVSYEVETPVITSPADGLITNDTEITVEGTASPTTSIQLLNNGEEVDTVEIGDDGTFEIPAELTEGENEFTAVSLLDGTPTGESEPVSVTLDTELPELTIDSPGDGDKSNRETVTVEGTVADAHLDYVEVNGQNAKVTDGSYSKRILLDEGANEIEVVAADLAGNTTVESVTLNVDFTPPEIENLTPTEDVYINAGESVKFEFDSEPGLKATYFIHMPLTNTVTNATELPMMETTDGHYVGYWTATSNTLAEGAVIEVKVVDSYGNEAREQAEGKLFINVE